MAMAIKATKKRMQKTMTMASARLKPSILISYAASQCARRNKSSERCVTDSIVRLLF